jgi:hypothetical protein
MVNSSNITPRIQEMLRKGNMGMEMLKEKISPLA